MSQGEVTFTVVEYTEGPGVLCPLCGARALCSVAFQGQVGKDREERCQVGTMRLLDADGAPMGDFVKVALRSYDGDLVAFREEECGLRPGGKLGGRYRSYKPPHP